MRPHVLEWDESQHFPVELLAKFAKLGITGVIIPEEYGGAGMGYIEYATILEELARGDPSIALSIAAHNSLSSGHIYLAASESQKRDFLMPLAPGEYLGAWGFAAPRSGPAANAMRTTA